MLPESLHRMGVGEASTAKAAIGALQLLGILQPVAGEQRCHFATKELESQKSFVDFLISGMNRSIDRVVLDETGVQFLASTPLAKQALVAGEQNLLLGNTGVIQKTRLKEFRNHPVHLSRRFGAGQKSALNFGKGIILRAQHTEGLFEQLVAVKRPRRLWLICHKVARAMRCRKRSGTTNPLYL